MTITADIGDWTVSWPYPKAFFLGNYVLAVTTVSTDLYLFEMFYEYGHWFAVAVVNLGTNSEIDQVDVADFGTFYTVSTFGYDSDGDVVGGSFVRDIDAEVGIGAVTALPTIAAPEFITSCNYNGQCVVGGITTSLAFDDTPSGELWQDWNLGNIVWSAIGSFDFRPNQDQTAGFGSIPWTRGGELDTKTGEGKVLKVAKLGKMVMAYCNYGRLALVPYAQEVSTGFGPKPLQGAGINSANHFAGDENLHCFIDTNNELWVADAKGTFEKLGYKEYIEGMTNADIRVSYVPQKKRFFISDGVTGYGLTEHGFYSINQLITSAGYHEGVFCGFWADSADYELRMETDVLDFNQRGMKTLSCLEFGTNYYKTSEVLETSTKYRYDYKTQSFSQTGWKELNPQGVAYPIITATEFKLLLRGGDYRNAEASLSYLTAKLKMSDKRSLRGRHNVSKITP